MSCPYNSRITRAAVDIQMVSKFNFCFCLKRANFRANQLLKRPVSLKRYWALLLFERLLGVHLDRLCFLQFRGFLNIRSRARRNDEHRARAGRQHLLRHTAEQPAAQA